MLSASDDRAPHAGRTVVEMYRGGSSSTRNSYRSHYCTGVKDKGHSKRIMQHIGGQKVGK